ncbi:hypothetical protein SLE2022_125570 [Rubroshorea leprosula]
MRNDLFASIDMGTNSFKLLIVQANPSGRFLPLLNLKEPSILGRGSSSSSSSSSITDQSRLLSLHSLQKFNEVISTHHVPIHHTRCVATAAVRAAENQIQFVESVKETVGLEVEVLSGEQEARLAYLGVLQFLPLFEKLVLNVDIGGGSTEFVIGKRGEIAFSCSLKLGHVTLTQKFGDHGENGTEKVLKMREYIRMVIKESGLSQKVKESGFEISVGSSGTIRAIEKAIFYGYAGEFVDKEVLFRECKKEWRFTKEDLRKVVDRLCSGEKREKIRRNGFFKRRSESIVAGAVLLEEIFELLGIEEMDVSGYGLGVGVISETLAKVFDGYNFNANARWCSVMQLATRFDENKRMSTAVLCAGIARDIFEGLRTCDERVDNDFRLAVPLDHKDLEYLEAACLLHNVGLFLGEKGYHKQSYSIIMNGDHLCGYSAEEVKFMALLTRYHRKKFPKIDRGSFMEFQEKVKQKFEILSAIIRISIALQQIGCTNHEDLEFSHSAEGFKLVVGQVSGRALLPSVPQLKAQDIGSELTEELKYFKMVFKKKLLLVLPSLTSNKS